MLVGDAEERRNCFMRIQVTAFVSAKCKMYVLSVARSPSCWKSLTSFVTLLQERPKGLNVTSASLHLSSHSSEELLSTMVDGSEYFSLRLLCGKQLRMT